MNLSQRAAAGRIASAFTTVPTRTETGQGCAHRLAWRAEIERQIEAAQHGGQPVGEIVGRAVEQKCNRAHRRRAAAAFAKKRSVENHWAFGHDFVGGDDILIIAR